jgi:hypothetical protein
MSANSKIEWTDHTFNPWRGCTKVSPGCAHCYAETLSKRNPKVLGEWGAGKPRVLASEAMWREPVKWNAMPRNFAWTMVPGAAAEEGRGHEGFLPLLKLIMILGHCSSNTRGTRCRYDRWRPEGLLCVAGGLAG